MKHKKAFEIQFNWIFVLVAGAAILIIFALVIFKQRSLSESSTSSIALRSMESVVDGTSVSADTSSVITVPDLSIEVDCGKISIGKISKQYPRLILFSPSSIKGSKIIAQTLSFSAPYKSSNLLFMTSQQVKYILIGDSNLIKSVNKSLTATDKSGNEQISKEIFSSYSPSIRNSNNYKVRFVFDNTDPASLTFPSSLSKMPDGDVTALKITGDIDKGTFDFYENKAGSFVGKGTSHYIGKAALIGAVYADTSEHYECNMKNVFARHGIVSDVYVGRTTLLYNDPSTGPECRRAYSDSLSPLSIIRDASKNLADTLPLLQSNIDRINSASESLSIQNKEAQKFSCPTIY